MSHSSHCFGGLRWQILMSGKSAKGWPFWTQDPKGAKYQVKGAGRTEFRTKTVDNCTDPVWKEPRFSGVTCNPAVFRV